MLTDTTCDDPTLPPLMSFAVGPDVEVKYPDELTFICTDERMLLGRKDRPNNDDSNLYLTVTTQCQWNKSYSVSITDYECVCEYCFE